jgi:hypothetical protein
MPTQILGHSPSGRATEEEASSPRSCPKHERRFAGFDDRSWPLRPRPDGARDPAPPGRDLPGRGRPRPDQPGHRRRARRRQGVAVTAAGGRLPDPVPRRAGGEDPRRRGGQKPCLLSRQPPGRQGPQADLHGRERRPSARGARALRADLGRPLPDDRQDLARRLATGDPLPWPSRPTLAASSTPPTRSRRCTASCARRSRPEDTSRSRRPPASSSTCRSSTPSRAGARPTSGRRRSPPSRSTSKTDCPDTTNRSCHTESRTPSAGVV